MTSDLNVSHGKMSDFVLFATSVMLNQEYLFKVNVELRDLLKLS